MSSQAPVIRRSPSAALLARLESRCLPDPWNEPALEKLLANPRVGAWSLHDDSGEARGLLLFQRVGAEAEIHRIGIDPGRRRAYYRDPPEDSLVLERRLVAEKPDSARHGSRGRER